LKGELIRNLVSFPYCLDKPLVNNWTQKVVISLFKIHSDFLLLQLFYYIENARFQLQEFLSLFYFKICSIEETHSIRTGIREISERIHALL